MRNITSLKIVEGKFGRFGYCNCGWAGTVVQTDRQGVYVLRGADAEQLVTPGSWPQKPWFKILSTNVIHKYLLVSTTSFEESELLPDAGKIMQKILSQRKGPKPPLISSLHDFMNYRFVKEDMPEDLKFGLVSGAIKVLNAFGLSPEAVNRVWSTIDVPRPPIFGSPVIIKMGFLNKIGRLEFIPIGWTCRRQDL